MLLQGMEEFHHPVDWGEPQERGKRQAVLPHQTEARRLKGWKRERKRKLLVEEEDCWLLGP